MTNPEQEKKTAWIKELSEFIVEANRETWAADKGEIEPMRPGDKTHEYKRGPWWLVDTYSGYFQAPGLTVIRYKDTPSWNMYYGGRGMNPHYFDITKDTFQFLREALMQVTPSLPIRGPEHYSRGEWSYIFKSSGDLENCTWNETVWKKGKRLFTQEGGAGIYIHRSEDRQPIYPWNL